MQDPVSPSVIFVGLLVGQFVHYKLCFLLPVAPFLSGHKSCVAALRAPGNTRACTKTTTTVCP